MKTQELKIEVPKGFEIDKERSTFDRIVFREVYNSFQKVLEYHKTTEKDFDELYKNIPLHVKYYEQEAMLAAFYNKGWIPNFKNTNERKYYTWFYMDEFRLFSVFFYLVSFLRSCSPSVEK